MHRVVTCGLRPVLTRKCYLILVERNEKNNMPKQGLNINFPHDSHDNRKGTDISRMTSLERLAADVTGRERA